MNQNFGLKPPGAEAQATYSIPFDTIYYAPDTALGDKTLFSSTESKGDTFRSYLLSNVSHYKELTIIGITATMAMQFTARSSEPASATALYFENFSVIDLQLLEKSYDNIPFHFILPYKRVWDTTTASIFLKDQPYFKFKDPILVPTGGNITLKFKPADNLTSGTSGVTNPRLATGYTGLSSDYKAFWIKFDFIATQKREVA